MNSPMVVDVNPKIYFKKQNQEFNESVESIIDDIFQTNKIDNTDYILVGDYVLEQVLLFTPFAEINRALKTYYNEIKSEIVPNLTNSSKFYENLVAYLMLHGGYDTYVIAGGMGTGKTSTCDFVVSLLEKKLSNKANFIINIKFDFNGPYDGTDDEIVAQFKRELYAKISLEIEDYFIDNPESLEAFCTILKDKNDKKNYTEFKDFKFYNDINWEDETLTQENKIKIFINFLNSHEDKINALMKIVYFIAHKQIGNTVILVFDNIDVLIPSCQRRILINVFKYNAIAKARCFLPLRRATFKRTLRDIQKDENARAAFNFGYIHHHGVAPIKVVIDRVNKFLANPGKFSILDSLPNNYKGLIISRFQTYKQFLENENNFSKFFTCISGRSSRLALMISKRFFINNVVEYSSNSFNHELGIKAFMVSTNSEYLFDNTYERDIANIFSCSSYGFFSFIPYLILNYVSLAKEIHQYELKYIYNKVRENLKNTLKKQDFIDILNYLLSVRRPLLWSDDKPNYDYTTDLEENLNTLQLTEVGRGYFDILKNNTQYIQECLLSIKWEQEYIPQHFDRFTLNERFAFLRKCILDIFNRERLIIKYDSSIKPLSTVLFTTIGNIYIYIIKKNNALSEGQVSELMNWNSLRTDLYNQYSFDKNSNETICNFLDRLPDIK